MVVVDVVVVVVARMFSMNSRAVASSEKVRPRLTRAASASVRSSSAAPDSSTRTGSIHSTGVPRYSATWPSGPSRTYQPRPAVNRMAPTARPITPRIATTNAAVRQRAARAPAAAASACAAARSSSSDAPASSAMSSSPVIGSGCSGAGATSDSWVASVGITAMTRSVFGPSPSSDRSTEGVVSRSKRCSKGASAVSESTMSITTTEVLSRPPAASASAARR